MVVPRDISEQRLDYVHWDMDGNQMFRYPMDIQEMGCATWDEFGLVTIAIDKKHARNL